MSNGNNACAKSGQNDAVEGRSPGYPPKSTLKTELGVVPTQVGVARTLARIRVRTAVEGCGEESSLAHAPVRRRERLLDCLVLLHPLPLPLLYDRHYHHGSYDCYDCCFFVVAMTFEVEYELFSPVGVETHDRAGRSCRQTNIQCRGSKGC